MPVQVFRCPHCFREVLVRDRSPMSAAEIARRLEEEMRPPARGQRGQRDLTTRMRDFIWEGVSGRSGYVPRDEPPEQCPACKRPGLEHSRTLEG